MFQATTFVTTGLELRFESTTFLDHSILVTWTELSLLRHSQVLLLVLLSVALEMTAFQSSQKMCHLPVYRIGPSQR